MDLSQITFDAWMELGLQRGFCTPPVCLTHDGIPTTASEDIQIEEGDDICIHIARFYESAEIKAGVEKNHSPTTWRNPYRITT